MAIITSSNRIRSMVALVISLASVLLVSCGSDDGFDTIPPAPRGFLRMVNAVPDAPTLRFDVNRREEARLQFGEASGLVDVLPDLRLVLTVYYMDNLTRVQIATSEFTIQVNSEFTLVVTGALDSPQLILIDNPPLESSDGTEIQFAHAATKGPAAVEVFIHEEDVTAEVPNALLSFGEATPLQTLPSGVDTELTARTPGEAADLWSSGSFVFPPANRLLLLLVDYFGPGDNTVRMLALGNAGVIQFPEEDLPAAIRVANMTPDKGPLDITIDTNTHTESLGFTGLTEHTEISPGNRTIKVTLTGQPDAVVSEGTFLISTGQFQTLTLSGLADENRGVISDDSRRRLSLLVALSVTHAAPSANPEAETGTVDIYLLEQGETVSGTSPDGRLDFLGSGTLIFDAGSYDLVLTNAGTNNIIFGPLRVDVGSNGLYKIFIHDSPGGGTPVEVTLEDDFQN